MVFTLKLYIFRFNFFRPKKIPNNFGIKIDYRHLNLSKVAFSNISRSSGCAISMSAFALCFKLFPYKLVAPNEYDLSLLQLRLQLLEKEQSLERLF